MEIFLILTFVVYLIQLIYSIVVISEGNGADLGIDSKAKLFMYLFLPWFFMYFVVKHIRVWFKEDFLPWYNKLS